MRGEYDLDRINNKCDQLNRAVSGYPVQEVRSHNWGVRSHVVGGAFRLHPAVGDTSRDSGIPLFVHRGS